MKKRIIAFSALFIISAAFGGCTENPDRDSGQSTQSVQTETSAASEQTSDTSTAAETEETTTVTPKTTVAATAETTEAVTGEAVSVANPILPPEAKPIYNILMANTDIIFADGVDGITLIDLDFDGTPELLVSKYWFDNGIDWYDFDDVDIYAIDLENECLNYIDTVYTNKRENVLGLKYTDTLERKWFLMSRDTVGSKEFYNSSDYLITLKDGKLHYEEIFGYRFTRFKEGSDAPIIDPYFMGEKIDPSSEKWSCFSEEDMDKWDIADGMHKQYCSDINIVYGLCSDWLAGEEDSMAPIKVDDISARSEIEKMTAHYYWEATSNTALIQYEY